MTDANLLLGYLNPAGLLDGTMPLFSTAPRAVFQREVADRLGLGCSTRRTAATSWPTPA